MNSKIHPSELHPTDDSQDPGAETTFGALYGAVETYRAKRLALEKAIEEVEVAERKAKNLRMELHYASKALDRAIERAHEKTFPKPEPERSTEAPSWQDATPEQDPTSSAPRPRDFDANDTGYMREEDEKK